MLSLSLELTRRWLFVIPELLKSHIPSIVVIQWCVDSLSAWSPIRSAIQVYNHAMLIYSSSRMGIGEVGIWEQDSSVVFIYCIDSRLRCVRDKFYCHIGWSSIACELFHKFPFRAERRVSILEEGSLCTMGFQAALKSTFMYRTLPSLMQAHQSMMAAPQSLTSMRHFSALHESLCIIPQQSSVGLHGRAFSPLSSPLTLSVSSSASINSCEFHLITSSSHSQIWLRFWRLFVRSSGEYFCGDQLHSFIPFFEFHRSVCSKLAFILFLLLNLFHSAGYNLLIPGAFLCIS